MYFIVNIYKHIFEEAVSRRRNIFRNNGRKYKDEFLKCNEVKLFNREKDWIRAG